MEKKTNNPAITKSYAKKMETISPFELKNKLIDMADESIKKTIQSIFSNVTFISTLSDLRIINDKKNILSDSKVIADYLLNTSTDVYFPKNLVADKCKHILSCLNEATQRISFTVHNFEV